MKSLLVFLTSCLAFTLVYAVVESWPKLHCLPGYSAEGGDKHAKDNNMACAKEISKDPKICKKECLYRWSGIMVRGKVDMGTQKSIENMLRRNFFTDTDEGKESSTNLATKIITDCKEPFGTVKELGCKEWTPFYECVDGIMLAC